MLFTGQCEIPDGYLSTRSIQRSDLVMMNLQMMEFVQNIQHSIKNNFIQENITKNLTLMKSFVNGDHIIDFDPSTFNRKDFLANHYKKWLTFLIEIYDFEFSQMISREEQEKIYDIFFMSGNLVSSSSLLCETISKLGHGIKLNKVVGLLQSFLQSSCISDLIWDECKKALEEHRSPLYGKKISPATSIHWDYIGKIFTNIPNLLTSKFKRECIDIFFPEKFIKNLTEQMLSVLRKGHESMFNSTDCSLEFVSVFLAKLCMVGFGDILWKNLIPLLVGLIENDFLWCRICHRIIMGVPDRCLESVIIPFITHCPHYSCMSKFLNDSILTSSKLKLLMGNKLLFQKQFSQIHILQNIIGYLTSSRSFCDIFLDVFKRLLDVWGDSSAVKHTSYTQQLYVSQAIMVCLAFLSKKDKSAIKSDVLRRMMSGMQVHLDSTSLPIRILGMVIAESVTKALDEPKLQFEYECDEDVKTLLSLIVKPEKNMGTFLDRTNTEFSPNESKLLKEESDKNEDNSKEATKIASDNESDDEFEAMDTSHDTKVLKEKTPLYLRECMDGIISSDNGDLVEICLQSAEQLIRKHPLGVEEVAVDFTKILLHLEDKSSISEFSRYRFKSMVALAVVSPKLVSQYLCKEFYDRNYNISQRLDILEVLTSALSELAQPQQETRHVNVAPMKKEENEWKDVVNKRIESKTRRFGKGRVTPLPIGQMNRVASVAGFFFYPLMTYFDQKENTLDLLGADHLVLSRLIYALGNIMYSSINIPAALQMGKTLWQFILLFRYHVQLTVRQATIYAFCMIVLAVPSYLLMTDMQDDILEARKWLQDVLQNDVDEDCKKKALQTLILLDSCLKKQSLM